MRLSITVPEPQAGLLISTASAPTCFFHRFNDSLDPPRKNRACRLGNGYLDLPG